MVAVHGATVGTTERLHSFLLEMDRVFISVLHEIERYYMEFSKAHRIRIEKWVHKLSLTGHNLTWKKHRNAYAKLLLHMILNRDISGPFASLPPEGSLPSFPVHLKAYSVRGAYDRTGGDVGLGEAESKWHTHPGKGSGAARYVAGSIINAESRRSLQHGRGSTKYLAGGPYGVTHSTLFWRDVYEAVREAPMGESVAQTVRAECGRAVDDERDIVINHIYSTPPIGAPSPPAPPAPPAGSPQKHYMNSTIASAASTEGKGDHSHEHTQPSPSRSSKSSAASHAGVRDAPPESSAGALRATSSKASTKSSVQAADRTISRSENMELPAETLEQRNKSMHEATRYIIEHGGGVTKFHYSTDEDGQKYMVETEEAHLEIRRLALLAREQKRDLDELRRELKLQKDDTAARLNKQAIEHVHELRAVLTGTCSKCNLALSGCDEEDSIDGQSPQTLVSSKEEAEPSTKAVKFAKHEQRPEVDSEEESQHLEDANHVHKAAGAKHSHSRRPLRSALRVDPKPRGAEWMGSKGVTVATDTTLDGPPNPLGRDRVAAAWESLLSMASDPLGGPAAKFPAEHRGPERYYASEYWSHAEQPAVPRPASELRENQTAFFLGSDHQDVPLGGTQAFAAHLCAKQAAAGSYVHPANGYVRDLPINTGQIPVFVPNTQPPQVGIRGNRSGLQRPEPSLKAIRPVHDNMYPKVPVAKSAESHTRRTHPEQSFAFLESQLEPPREHWEHSAGTVGTMFGPKIRAPQRF